LPSDIPEYFSLFDLRKPVNTYVEDKLDTLLQEVFEVRRKVEKTLSRNELLAYDRVLAAHLTKEALLPRLREACEGDRNHLHQLKQLLCMSEEGTRNEHTQHLKTVNDQREINRAVKDEDALYKFLAYSGVLEKQRRENLDKTRKDLEIAYGVDNFPEFYKQEL